MQCMLLTEHDTVTSNIRKASEEEGVEWCYVLSALSLTE